MTRYDTVRRLSTILFAGLLIVALPASSLAAKGGKKAHLALLAGESVTVTGSFTFASPATVTYTSADPSPWVQTECYANGSLVLVSYLDVFRGSDTFYLGPTPSWLEGGAECVSRLLHFNTDSGEFDWPPLAEYAFTVTE